MIFRILGYLLFLLTFILSVEGQSVVFDNPKIIDESHGLPSNVINDIEQDSLGFIWIGTDNGLCKYDGQQLTLFQEGLPTHTLSNNMIYDIHYNEKRQQLWVGTGKGLNVLALDGSLLKTHIFNVNDINSLGDNLILETYEDRQQEIWVSTWAQGFARYDATNEQFERFYYNNPDWSKYDLQEDNEVNIAKINSIVDIKQDLQNDSILWLGTLEGIVRFNKISKKFDYFFRLMEDKNLEYHFNSITYLYPHTNGKIYFGTLRNLGWFHPITEEYGEVVVRNEKGKLPLGQEIVNKITRKSTNELWVTYKTGLVIYNTQTEKVVKTFFNQPKAKLNYGVEWVDNKGRVWAEGADGVYIYDPLYQQTNRFTIPNNYQSYNNNYRKVVDNKDRTKLFCCANYGAGIYVLDRETKGISVIKPPASALNKDKEFECSDLLRLPNGKLLVLSQDAILELSEDETALSYYPQQIAVNAPTFRRLFMDSQSNLWVTSRREGVFKIAAKNREIEHFKEVLNDTAYSGNYTWLESMTEDKKGNIWFRLARSFTIYQPAIGQFLQFPYYGTNTFKYITNFVEDEYGNMWAGSENNGIGIAKGIDITEGLTHFMTTEDGLLSNAIRHLTKDKTGNIWAVSDRGLTKIDPTTYAIENISWEYGIPSGTRLDALASGKFAIGAIATEQLALIQPNAFFKNKELPKPYVSKFKVYEQDIANMDSLLQAKSVTLQPGQNFFSLNFSAIGYSFADDIQFAYKMEGFDDEWIMAGDRKFAYYSNLNGGTYQFKLKAKNNEGIWNLKIYKLKLEVLVPFWEESWFHGLLVALAIFFTVLFYRYRINRAIETEKLKAAYEKQMAEVKMNSLTAQMNPHFIFNCLNSIEYYIIKNKPQKAADYLNRFSRLIRLILNNSRSNLVTLKNELEVLRLYIEIESLRFDNKFDYVVSMDKNINPYDIEIPPMLLQPYVENAIWHGLMHTEQKGLLEILLRLDEEARLHCTIKDNGIGRAKAAALKSKSATRHKRKSMGMNITQDRLEMLKKLQGLEAVITVTDLKSSIGEGIGTQIDLLIPV